MERGGSLPNPDRETVVRQFLPLTRINAIIVPSLGNGSPRTFQRAFALVNPLAIVSYTIRSEAT